MSRSVLVIDVGGTNVKLLASGQKEPRKFPSGPKLTPKQMVIGVRQAAKDWKYDTVSIGYPGPVVKGRITKDPHNLGRGWKGFDFKAAFKRPVKIMNDAGMQALGSYRRGTMLFLGFGTGFGSALVVEGVVVPMELAHLSYRKGTYEDYLGLRGLKRLGKRKWRKHVAYCVARLIAALYVDDVVLGGGNAKKLADLPERCRIGTNANAFRGVFAFGRKLPRASMICSQKISSNFSINGEQRTVRRMLIRVEVDNQWLFKQVTELLFDIWDEQAKNWTFGRLFGLNSTLKFERIDGRVETPKRPVGIKGWLFPVRRGRFPIIVKIV